MRRAKSYAQPGLLIRHAPLNRRQRMARMRAIALAAIGVIAVSGVVLQRAEQRRPVGTEVASTPSPFDYFPG